LDTCLHEKGKAMAVEKVGGAQTHWPAKHMARPAGHHLVSYRSAKSVELPHGPINTPLPVKVNTHTHTPHFGDSTFKALFLSVVARRSLVGRVVRL
jgi:hypothetical protein